MTIGILTRRYGYNMGSTLQAFAMSEMLASFGHKVEIINYDETAAHFKWKIRPFLERLMYKLWIPPTGAKRNYLSHRISQEKKFNEFENKYIPLSKEKIRSKRQLTQISKKYNKIVIGSDQIWNPFLYDPVFFGEFLPVSERKKIIAYAPSLGVGNSEEILTEQKSLINSLSFISCREEKGADVLKEITGRKIPVVLDPTLMVNREIWDKIADEHSVDGLPDDFIVTYFLGKDIHQMELDSLSIKYNAKIINISMFNKPNAINAFCHLKNLGPGEFLYLIKHAKYVATDSFHATIFSWIFQTEFKTFMRFKLRDKESQNSRIETLLSLFEVKDKIIEAKKK